MEINIAIVGALSAITVSVIGALLTQKNSIVLEYRKLKEAHYVQYIEALHTLAADNRNTSHYTFARDKLLIVANENVIKKMLSYENNLKNNHDYYLTELIKAIRKDLNIKDKNFPPIFLKK